MSRSEESEEARDPDRLDESVRERRRRREAFEAAGERSLAENLALMGSVGWLIVVPTLAGIYLGRRLDRALGGGIFWTATATFVGAVFGSYLAWKRIGQEPET